MASNNLTIEQSFQFMQNLYEQAVGKGNINVVDTSSFITVGQAVLKCGYEQTLNAISVVLDRTIFSVRPYRAKFRGIAMDSNRWGGITRKINYIDGATESAQEYELIDGQSIDHYRVNKPKVVQSNFYGGNSYQRHITIMQNQLDTAFSNAEEFGRFIGGLIQNQSDLIEQDRENESRAALINMAAGKYVADVGNCVNVLQEYYNETGTALTVANMYSQENYEGFVKWFYGYVNTMTDRLSERSYKYHMNITGKEISRHTPENRLKAYLSSKMLNNIAATVLSSVFNEDRLKMIDFEKVVYWQNINDPEKIIAKPVYLNVTDGSLINSENDITIDNMLGMLFDEDALGINMKYERTVATPVNAAGLYYNIYYHYAAQTFNDFMENCIVFYAADPTLQGTKSKS